MSLQKKDEEGKNLTLATLIFLQNISSFLDESWGTLYQGKKNNHVWK